jgi:tetratricopeptide (TPR) repeat protein
LRDGAGLAGSELLVRGRAGVSVERAVEVHRLAVAGGEAMIAREVGALLGRVWLRTSRFADVEVLATATMSLGPDAGAFYDRGWARFSTGQPWSALEDCRQALALCREAGNRRNEANTLNNIGNAYHGLGDRRQAQLRQERTQHPEPT